MPEAPRRARVTQAKAREGVPRAPWGPLAFPWVPLALPGCLWPPKKITKLIFCPSSAGAPATNIFLLTGSLFNPMLGLNLLNILNFRPARSTKKDKMHDTNQFPTAFDQRSHKTQSSWVSWVPGPSRGLCGPVVFLGTLLHMPWVLGPPG